jgi:ferredoxin
MALLMVVMATLSLAVFERNAFCRYFCPVGRTIGAYSQLAPIELRPINTTTCADCTTLDCYHGNEEIEPCPTWLVMGRLRQNSYCTSCGNCSQSCPHQNIDWRLRSPGAEALQSGRPHWDEAWFMLGLLALTGFHGITMMPFWERDISQLGRLIGDSGQLLWSFSIGLVVCLLAVVSLYAVLVWFTQRLSRTSLPYQRLFATLAFVTLPLAFAYHVAHNLSHLVRESAGIGKVLLNPFGTNTLPLDMAEMDQRMSHMMISPGLLHAIQAGLIAAGFVLAVQIIRHRCKPLLQEHGQRVLPLLPMLLFAVIMTGFHLWLLMQPMVMRM